MKILIGMSGGVDSAYAAVKLKEAGHEVEGAVLVMHDYTDVDSARAVAERVGIPLHTVDCRADFDKFVRDNFVSEYMQGRTPNPCIVCNREVKFKYLYEYAMMHGFDKIATGHYADIVKIQTPKGYRYAFKKAGDVKKDQTYMLYRLPQNIISTLVLPMAKESKEEVKAVADRLGILPRETKESQEICFLPDGDYASYVESVGGKSKEGYFVDERGSRLGKHKGIVHYTLGQRKGLGISLGARAFVSEIDAESGDITLTTEGKFEDELYVDDIVFSGIEEQESGKTLELAVKLRYQAPAVNARVTFLEGGALIELEKPVKAITPGQSAVLYLGDVVVAGGFIRLRNKRREGNA